MHLVTRRSFVRRSLAGSVGIAVGSMMNVPGFLRSAIAEDAPGYTWNGKKLLFIFLRGGNDALNTLIPSGDPAYLTSRPTIGIRSPDDPLTTGGTAPETPQADRAIDLGNGFATMHPNLSDLIPIYNAGELALIHRVGYPNQSRSHFDSQRYWETAFPRDDSDHDGLFYRTVIESGLHQSQVMPAVTFNRTMPLLLQGDQPLVNISNPSRFDLLGVYAAARQKHIESIAAMHGLPYAQRRHRDLTVPTGTRFLQSIDEIAAIPFSENDTADFLDPVTGDHLFPIDDASNDKGFSSSSRSFFESLKYSAQVLADSGCVISGCELGGFDTHDNQGGLNGSHPDRMAWLGWAMHALKTYFMHKGLWNDVAVVTMTEFGRTSIENGSRGTDHAEGGAMMVAGGGITGGVRECDPNQPEAPWVVGSSGSMFGVNGRYLSRTVDYRSVLGELIRDHLGIPQPQLDRIIPAYSVPAESLLNGGTAPDGIYIRGELGLLA